jgi:hypothetical protein
MVYILFNSSRILGLYETINLVQVNSFVLLYRMMNEGKIDKDNYFKVKKELMESTNIQYEELKELLSKVNIYVDYHDVEKNGLYAFEIILKHINSRFDKLEDMMSKDSRISVKFPGRSAIDNLMINPEIESHWRMIDMANYDTLRDELFKFMIKKIQKLELNFEGRVKFGVVSDTEASETSYQVWPADQENWNLPVNSKIPGEGLAVCFQYQVPGVYGIVVDPVFGYDKL